MEAENSKTDLCATCCWQVPECGGWLGDSVEFGDGFGNDNVIKCDCYEKPRQSTVDPLR